MLFLLGSLQVLYFYLLFIYWWYGVLNSGPHACTLPLEPVC
jgi:hypothetical protein